MHTQSRRNVPLGKSGTVYTVVFVLCSPLPLSGGPGRRRNGLNLARKVPSTRGHAQEGGRRRRSRGQQPPWGRLFPSTVTLSSVSTCFLVSGRLRRGKGGCQSPRPLLGTLSKRKILVRPFISPSILLDDLKHRFKSLLAVNFGLWINLAFTEKL